MLRRSHQTKVVDLEGFEPSTSSMHWKRAPNRATGPLLSRLKQAVCSLQIPGQPRESLHKSNINGRKSFGICEGAAEIPRAVNPS
jgi:hypothetical protein